MPSPEPFCIFTRKFNQLEVPYTVTGSLAAIFYGKPRLTNDVDLVVFLQRPSSSSDSTTAILRRRQH
jgi:hypothetical protein